MNALRHLLVVLGIVATLFLIAGCGGGGGGETTPDPVIPPQPPGLQVVETTPQGGSADAEPDTTIEVRFSETLDDAMLPNPPLIVRENGSVVTGAIHHDEATGVLRFVPTEPFAFGMDIEVTARAGITSTAGDAIPADVAVGFRTRLPELGGVVNEIATPDFERVLAFEMNDGGKGVIVYADERYGQHANLIARRFDLQSGAVIDTTLGSGSSLVTDVRSVGVASNGDIVVAWRSRNNNQWDAFARIYDASLDTWTNTNSIEISGTFQAFGLVADISPAGSVIAWLRGTTSSNDADYIGIKTWEPGSGWVISSSAHAGTGLVSYLRLAMGASGHTVLAWAEEQAGVERVRARTWTAAGGLTAHEVVDGVAPTAAVPYAAAVNASGHKVLVFLEQTSASERTLWAVRHGGGTPGWHSAVRLESDRRAFVLPTVAAAGDGALAVAWVSLDTTTTTFHVRRLDATSGWDAPASQTVPFLDVSWSPQIDGAPDGTFVAAVTTRDGVVMDIHARTYAPTSAAWSPLALLHGDRYAGVRALPVAAWRDGHGYVAWTAGIENPVAEEREIRGRWVGPDGAAADLDEIDATPSYGKSLAGVALDIRGLGRVVWQNTLDIAPPGEADIHIRRFR